MESLQEIRVKQYNRREALLNQARHLIHGSSTEAHRIRAEGFERDLQEIITKWRNN